MRPSLGSIGWMVPSAFHVSFSIATARMREPTKSPYREVEGAGQRAGGARVLGQVGAFGAELASTFCSTRVSPLLWSAGFERWAHAARGGCLSARVCWLEV